MTRYRNWAIFFCVSGLIWTFIPTNLLIFLPVVIVWIVVALAISSFLATLIDAWLDGW